MATNDFVGPAFPESPFQDLTAGSKTAQSVDAYRAGNPALWGNMYSAIQTGKMRIGNLVRGQNTYDESGNLLNADPDRYQILNSDGSDTGWRAEQVAPNVYDLATTNGDYLQHMVFRTDPNYGYIEPIQNTQQQINFGRWNYAGSGLSQILQNPVAGMMASALLPQLAPYINTALAASSGNVPGALIAASGIPGVSDTVNPDVSSAIKTAFQANNLVNAIESGNPLSAIAAGTNLTGTGGTEIGDTGVTLSDIVKSAQIANAVASNNPLAALAPALSLAQQTDQIPETATQTENQPVSDQGALDQYAYNAYKNWNQGWGDPVIPTIEDWKKYGGDYAAYKADNPGVDLNVVAPVTYSAPTTYWDSNAGEFKTIPSANTTDETQYNIPEEWFVSPSDSTVQPVETITPEQATPDFQIPQEWFISTTTNQPELIEPLPQDNSANSGVLDSYQNSGISDATPSLLPDYLGSNTQQPDQVIEDQNTQPENLGVVNSFESQNQPSETQPMVEDVVSQSDLQDNQPTSAQGTSMADILDSLGDNTTDITGEDASNYDLNAATADLQNIYGGDLSMQDVANAFGDNTQTGATGSTSIADLIKGLLPKSPIGQAALASGVGGVLQGLIGSNASTKAAQMQSDAAKAALAQQQSIFNTLNAQQAPYRSAGYGALNQIQGMLPGQYTKFDAQGNPAGTATGTGYLTQQFTPELFQQGIDPGYAWRLQQGQMAAQRQGNVAGGGLGGNVQKGLQDYTQGQASQEYQNAFNRFQTQRSNIYNTLAGIAGIGQTGQGQTNQLGTNLANAQTNLGVGSAGAQAAGQIGQANAYGGALNSINQALMLSQLPDIAAAMKGQ